MTTRFFGATVLTALAMTTLLGQDSNLIAVGAKGERVATGFGFLEGPAADADGNLYFSDIVNERIHRWSPETGVTVFRERTGQANGLRVDVDGTLLVCEMANRQVTAIDHEGRRTILADRYEGQRFNSPNDLWVDPRGGIYFSDPRYGPTDDQEIKGNHVYYLSPDRETLLRVTDDLIQPNGIVGTPDGSRVYIADPGLHRGPGRRSTLGLPPAGGRLVARQAALRVAGGRWDDDGRAGQPVSDRSGHHHLRPDRASDRLDRDTGASGEPGLRRTGRHDAVHHGT